MKPPRDKPNQMTGRLHTAARLLSFLRPFLSWVGLSVLLGVATIASGIALLGTSAYLIAYAALQPSVAALQVAIVGVRFFGISRAVFRYLERLASHSVNFRLLASLRVWYYKKLEPLVPAQVQEERSADLLSRAVADIETLESFYVRAVAPPVVALVVTLGVSWFVGRYDLRLPLLLASALGASGVGLPLLAYYLSRRPGQAVVEEQAGLNAAVLDMVQGMPDLLAFGQRESQLVRIQASGRVLSQAQLGVGRSGALVNALETLVSGLALIGVLLLLIPRVNAQELSGIGLAVAALVVLASFEAVNPLGLAAQHLESSLHAARRLFDVADRTHPIPESQAALDSELSPNTAKLQSPPVSAPARSFQPAVKAQGMSLVIRDLTFAYTGEREPVLVDFSLDLPAGKHVGLVGASGSGKTTLFNLLLRFWDFQHGQILVDGQDIRAWRVQDLRRQMALIEPSAYLFHGTLRENLLLARPSASQDELSWAVEAAQLTGWVAGLKEGLDTHVGERAVQLSGGERQRVAVARGLLQNARLLLMDEPTASLDALGERALIASLRQASAGRSLLMIAHRLVGLETLDEILVLKSGRVIERGTHAELLARGGLFAKMWQAQRDLLE